ncbi:MAG: ATP-dependent DNA ligase [Anaeromyxobacter sp. RBG_16_69_14]|nr:MAG: ATP-dependent DNA ligase [Anaeromyxobacter sp. RBG_16_69_14]
MSYPIAPPVEPMLATLACALPEGEGWLFEPKWDGFRVLVFRDGSELHLQSRERRPLNRYFPELVEPLLAHLPDRCVADGEIVIAGEAGLDFEALLLRIHPAASRVKLLAQTNPSGIVLFDLLALGDRNLQTSPLVERRALLERALADGAPSVHVTPATRDRDVAQDWFSRFEGAGLDGVVAKRLDSRYQPGVRAMVKVKHGRTADCAVGGFRWYKDGKGTMVGSLLLGLYDDPGELHHVGICSSFTSARRKQLVEELAPLRQGAADGHPWRDRAGGVDDEARPELRRPGASSRWNRTRDLSWEPLRVERVCEVAYDHLQGNRFRHATRFLRWRPDRSPRDCRYDQLEVTPPYELSRILSPGR